MAAAMASIDSATQRGNRHILASVVTRPKLLQSQMGQRAQPTAPAQAAGLSMASRPRLRLAMILMPFRF